MVYAESLPDCRGDEGKPSMARRKPPVRSETGKAVTVLNILIGVFIVAITVAMSYELSRFFLARSQLKTCIESASLAAKRCSWAAAKARAKKRKRAEDTALNIFRKNTILSASMATATVAPDLRQMAPRIGSAQICFDYLDPLTHQPGSSKGNVLRVTGAYRFQVFSGFFLGLGANSYVITVSSTTALPAVDLVLAFRLIMLDGRPDQRFNGLQALGLHVELHTL